MVLAHTSTHSYPHPFPTVTLAFFLRYYSPQLNPFSSHVLSTDTIDSRVDPETGRLHTTRLHVKRSRMPATIMKMLPTSVTGGSTSQSAYVLETSVVDIKEGWMKTQSRNLNFTGVLSVLEEQHYSVTPPDDPDTLPSETGQSIWSPSPGIARLISPNTYVTTTFSYRSTIGNRKATKAAAANGEEAKPGRLGGWISGWGTRQIQSSIESIASNKTNDQMSKSRDGMGLVLERLRANGVVATLRELRRQSGQAAFEA